MTGASFASWGAFGLGGTILGVLFGLLYFAALQRSVELYGASCRIAPSALTLARLTGAIVFFGLVGWLGAVCLLSAFLGFLIARTVALRTGRSVA